HMPHELLAAGEQAETGAADAHRVAQSLPLADSDVRAALAGRAQQREADRVEDGDEQRARGVRDVGRGGPVLDHAEEVGALDDDGGRVVADGGAQRVLVEPPVLAVGDGPDLEAHAPVVRLEHATVVRVQAAGYRDGAPGAARDGAGHAHRLRGSPGARVHRWAGHIQAGQLADQALELVDGLERALTDLRLVGRVCGIELRTAEDHVHRRRNVMVVDAAACEADQRFVRGRLPGELASGLPLGQRGRQVQRPVEPVLLRDLGEEVFDRFYADYVQHAP